MIEIEKTLSQRPGDFEISDPRACRKRTSTSVKESCLGGSRASEQWGSEVWQRGASAEEELNEGDGFGAARGG